MAETTSTPGTATKLIAEALGTFLLVFGSIGTALFAANFGASENGTSLGVGFLGVSLAFGLTLMAGIYTWGPISGGHFNPAVTFGLAAAGRFAWKDVPGYLIAQVIGGAVVPAGATGAVVSVRVTILPDDLFEGPEDLELQVSFAPPHATLPCSAGTLWVCDAEQLGERFCLTNANSTGAPASITAWNVSPYKAGEAITLEATQLPTDAIGYFLVSPVTRPAYPVASWYLCIGNSLHRVLGNGQVPQSAGPDGRITIEFDRAVDAGPYFVQPGDTLHFQAWHSDPALGTSNATGALSVVMR